jgi:hypothetical protein
MAKTKPLPPGFVCNSNSREAYQGSELRSFSLRPGAMDAYALPSLYGDQRRHYRTGQLIEQKGTPET